MQQTIDTLAELKAIRFSVFDEIFCKETSREYFFKQDGGLTPDDLEIVTTAQGGNWRLVAKTGKGGGADGAGTIASQAEAEAGTENTKAMSALRTAQAIAAQVVSPVSSVHGRTGAVTAQAGDYAGYYADIAKFTAPVAWTPTFTGFGTVSGVTAYSWRVGAELFFEITVTLGTVTATEARISLGYNGTDGNVSTVSSYPTLQQVGVVSPDSLSGFLAVALAEASKSYIVFGIAANGVTNALEKRNGNAFISNTKLSIKGSVRITGW